MVLGLTGSLWEQLLKEVDHLSHVPARDLLTPRELLMLLSLGKAWIGSVEGARWGCRQAWKAMELVEMRH